MRPLGQAMDRPPWFCVGGRAAGAALIAFGIVSCAPPDEPPTTSGELPAPAVAYLNPARVSAFRLETGVCTVRCAARQSRGASTLWR